MSAALRHRRKPALLALLGVTALVATACGSDSSTASSSTSAATSAAGSAVSSEASSAGSSPASSAGSSPVGEALTLSATTYRDWTPAAYENEAGELTGYFTELETAAATAANWTLEWDTPAFEAVIPGVQSGKYDLGGGVDITAERLKVIDIVSVIRVGYTFLTLADGGAEVADDTTALCGVRVGAVAAQASLEELGEISDACVAAGQPAVEISTYANDSAGLLALKSGNIDVRTINTAEGGFFTKSQPEFAVTGPIITQVDAGIAFAKGSPLAQQFADAVNKTIEDGTYAQILESYGAQEVAITRSEVSPTPMR
ncbi:transporter substrate-binding domain-containing protein [Nakamurella alba]|uniref:transporter substrate-binding domain-containing protein n=1 Tax=Nakamurella alba TaxID=2665158 RepID=UPI002AC33AFA|nr:transporter substrate-binding domain-containing protein [Nakamurella alba]